MSQTLSHTAPVPHSPHRWIGWLVGVLLLLGAVGAWQAGDIAWTNMRQYTNTPAGTYSDLAQRWVGARVALFERRSPYSPAVVDEIQQVYYGRVIGADEPHRPLYPQGFYYPLFLVWLLAPLAVLPFPLASLVFKFVAGGLLVGGAYGYLQILGWPASKRARLALAVSALILPAGLEVVSTDQPTVLVYGLLIGALIALSRGRYGLAGGLLALAWIKPQVAAPLTLGLGLWAVAERPRWRLLISGVLTALALLVSSEWLVPGWLGDWVGTLTEYTTVTNGIGAAATPPGIDWVGLSIRGVLVLIVLPLWWAARGEPFASRRLQWGIAATLVVTTVVQQPWHFSYNQILTYPALLLLLAETAGRERAETPPPPRTLTGITLALVLLPGLCALLIVVMARLNLIPQGTSTITVPDLILLVDKLPFGLFLLSLLFTYATWGWALATRPRAVVEPAITQHPI